ncbi:GNAT family N-acetyltransferase [Glycomyces albidus]|uniref:GNAT family N-acetyltransferase n=1 Tax=Glycomyces albidus TaxID=2656774 RepID=A0A6L5G489_9ACTN|nr:GNAT family N-acetyltransferase [Glycomyces albidus]MQM24447.1 GNAT family N-acetyltransferase [Glycomyces albidus]
MHHDPLTTRARTLWQALAAAPVAFPSNGGLQVVASPGSMMCPPSWTGIVALGDAAIATVPTDRAAELVQRALRPFDVESLTDPTVMAKALPVRDVLGPAMLAYVSRDAFTPPQPDTEVERLPPEHPDLQALLDSAGEDDADESGIAEITSPAFVVREHGRVVAASGYRLWPEATAHMCVLTAEAERGRGLAKRVAGAAVAHALAADLLPQWRARLEASRRVARALGFRELGGQLSVDLDLDRFEASGPG